MLPLQLPAILGRDVSGTVVAVGPEVTEFQVGDRVMGLVEHGYAELVVAPVEAFAKLPVELELERAAALPLVGLTGTQLIDEGVQVQGGQRVLVTGALGSVGRVAVFIARKRGAQIVAGVRARQRDEAASLEVDEIVALDDPREIERMRPIDAIADTVNGKAVQAVLDKVIAGGVVGTVLEPPLGAKEQGLRVHPILAHPDPKQLAALGEAVVRGELVLPIDKRYELSDVQTAQQVAEAGGVGKVLLLPSQ
jgi:NADPH:quinone reductase-like Zn-dependent oxidoreductase